MALSKVNPNFVEQTPYGRRNLIINGAMQVAQRGTSFTTSVLQSSTYTVDRWLYYNDVVSKRTIEQSSTSPNGFNNSLKVTVIATDTTGPQQFLRCYLEGQNLTALDWASGSGNSATLSFWVRSSVTGQHGGAIQDSNGAYSYPFAYTITSANVWEHKTVYITAPTGGTWNYTNGRGMSIAFENGVGYQKNTAGAWTTTNATSSTGSVNLCATNGATWYITGIQLELGATATPFEHRSFGEEWDACQRYCTVYNVGAGNTHPQNLVSPNHPVPGAPGHNDVSNRPEWFMSYPVKRATPTITVSDPTFMRWLASSNVVVDGNGSVTFPVGTGHQNANVFQGVASGIATSNVPLGWVHNNGGTYPKIIIDAEL